MQERPIRHRSFIIKLFEYLIEWGNEWLTLSHWLFTGGEYIFVQIEILVIFLTLGCLALLVFIPDIPSVYYPLIYGFFFQRILEFIIVYTRNFIFRRGRIFSQFNGAYHRGVWLILMFTISALQVELVFATLYRMISLNNPAAFTRPLSLLDSLYFSADTFFTTGFGDITPVADLPRVLVMLQGCITFFVLAIVINGLVSVHYSVPTDKLSEPQPEPEKPKK